jgi:hypothetical protein
VFATGASTSLCGGLFAARFGPFAVAAFCAFAVALSMATAALGSLPALIVAGMFGWNGIFLAEVARLAPSDRVAEATGAVLVASYTGLLAGPGVAGLAAAGTLSRSYAGLVGLTVLATLMLIGARR